PRPCTTRTTSTASCSRRNSTRRCATAREAWSTGATQARCSATTCSRPVRRFVGTTSSSAPPGSRSPRRTSRVSCRERTRLTVDLGLRGRAAVVAGGSRGIGRVTAGLLAREGCRVAVLARTPKDLRETEEELLVLGAEDAIGLECDLLHTGEVEAAFTFLDERWNECHALVNTVGPAHVGSLEELSDDT